MDHPPDTPDFDVYATEPALVSATSVTEGVQIEWADAVHSTLPLLWLREFSPESHHPVTREPVFCLPDLPDDLAISAARVDASGYLEIDWLPEAITSRYHPGWLRAHAPNLPPREELPNLRLWPAGEHRVEAHEGSAVLAAGIAFEAWLTDLARDGLALVTRLPLDADIVPQLPQMIGPLRPSNFGDVWDVENLPSANSNAYTAIALEPHNDLATREYVPGLQFLFCLANEAEGGDSLFVDGYAVAEQLRADAPAHFDLLSRVPVQFATRDRHSDYRYCGPIIELDAQAAIANIRFTYWLRTPPRGSAAEINALYTALRDFQRRVNDPGNQLRMRLQPGQLVAFDNRRILHGRTAFDAQSGKRLLRGCYGEREELHSQLRMLARQRRAETLV